MKQLLAGVAILFVVGIASFLYRNTVERPGVVVPEGACTMEAKICPDGTSVGREGPSCAFSPCPAPNVEISSAGVGFVIPEGYRAGESASGTNSELLAVFVKPSLSEAVSHTIRVYQYQIPEGKTADDVILARTRYQPADEAAEDFARFSTKSVNGKVFRTTTIERFEALVHTSYFLARGGNVLRFDITEHDVTDWMDPGLAIDMLPEHQAVNALLASLQATP